MPETDATNLLGALFEAIEHAGHLEKELHRTAEAVATWKHIAETALRALDQEMTRRREEAANA
jgi:hypothetical protein